MTRDTAFLWKIVAIGFHPQGGSLMSFTLQLSSFTRKQLYRRLQQAYASGSFKLVKRIHALLALAQGQSVSEVAEMLSLGEQTVRDYRNQYLFKADLTQRHPLKAYDAVQLAVALRYGPILSGHPFTFVSGDSTLLAAVHAEGLVTENPFDHVMPDESAGRSG